LTELGESFLDCEKYATFVLILSTDLWVQQVQHPVLLHGEFNGSVL